MVTSYFPIAICDSWSNMIEIILSSSSHTHQGFWAPPLSGMGVVSVHTHYGGPLSHKLPMSFEVSVK